MPREPAPHVSWDMVPEQLRQMGWEREQPVPPPLTAEEEFRQERRQTLEDLVTGGAWQELVRPALIRRREAVMRTLATAHALEIGHVRELQGQYRALSALIEEPLSLLRED